MSVARSIKRQMFREEIQDALQLEKLKCPKCGHPLQHKGAMSKKVFCTKCGFRGRTK